MKKRGELELSFEERDYNSKQCGVESRLIVLDQIPKDSIELVNNSKAKLISSNKSRK